MVAQPQSEVALLYSYDSHWAIRFQKHTEKYQQRSALLKSYYQALRQITQSVDVISAYAALDGYKLVAAPSLNVLPEEITMTCSITCATAAIWFSVHGPASKDEFKSIFHALGPKICRRCLGCASGAVPPTPSKKMCQSPVSGAAEKLRHLGGATQKPRT